MPSRGIHGGGGRVKILPSDSLIITFFVSGNSSFCSVHAMGDDHRHRLHSTKKNTARSEMTILILIDLLNHFAYVVALSTRRGQVAEELFYCSTISHNYANGSEQFTEK